jgi:transcriptional regulator with XRE-family HTH domain
VKIFRIYAVRYSQTANLVEGRIMGVRQTGTVDWSKFGALLRLARVNAGFRQGKTFVAFMEKETGCKISVDTLYRIESGDQEPPLSLFMAMNLTLGRIALNDDITSQTMSQKWHGIEEANKTLENGESDILSDADALYYDDEVR